MVFILCFLSEMKMGENMQSTIDKRKTEGLWLALGALVKPTARCAPQIRQEGVVRIQWRAFGGMQEMRENEERCEEGEK